MVCLEELDTLKYDDGEKGSNARECIRFMEALRQTGNLISGVPLQGGGTLRIEPNFTNVSLPENFFSGKNDNRILKVCKGLNESGIPAVLVTKDIVVRLKAQMMGLEAQDFTTEQSPVLPEQYTGRIDVYTSDDNLSVFKKKGLSIENVYSVSNDKPYDISPIRNQFFVIHSEISNKKTMLGCFNGESIVPLIYQKERPFGVRPRNVGQYFLQEALMADAESCPLVIVKGAAGTAKTFYSLAVGLDRVMNGDMKKYRRILVTRPNVQFDADIGFLPGSEQEKIEPFMRPIIDNLEILVDSNDEERYKSEVELKGKIDELFTRKIVTAEAMNFIRGRTITQTYLIIDEAQNLTPKQAKGIITRVGKGTKVILLGDPQQIDHPLLDERTNGLSYAGEKMKNSPLCYQITMQADECERSPLAYDAANRM